jgi:fructose-1,6-bisphosphatase/inositol monophosphatase family enzyme
MYGPQVRAPVGPAPDPEIEALFRVCAVVHRTLRQATTSPHQADVVAMGADGTPTEQLDRAAEAQVLEFLETEGLPWNVLSEEVGAVDRGGELTLVVDPVDGTHNALRGLPFYTISAALGRGSLRGIEVGVIHDLANGSTWWARKGTGAYRDGRRISTRTWDARTEMFFVNLGRHSTAPALRLAERGRRIRSLGCASLEMTLVAQGGADAYLFENDSPNRNLRVTDIAGAYRILEEAGGGVTDAAGAPIEDLALALDRRTSVLGFGDRAFLAAYRSGVVA